MKKSDKKKSLGFFDILNNINQKTGDKWPDIEGYEPFIMNKMFMKDIQTLGYASEANHHDMTGEQNYYYYLYSIPKGKRFFKGIKKDKLKEDNINVIIEYYQCNRNKANEYLEILTTEQLLSIKETLDKGGK